MSWLDEGLTLKFRAGGEDFSAAWPAPSAAVETLAGQEAAILPWMRSRIPLLFRGGELVAVGDLWLAAETGAPERDRATLARALERTPAAHVIVSSRGLVGAEVLLVLCSSVADVPNTHYRWSDTCSRRERCSTLPVLFEMTRFIFITGGVRVPRSAKVLPRPVSGRSSKRAA